MLLAITMLFESGNSATDKATTKFVMNRIRSMACLLRNIQSLQLRSSDSFASDERTT
jgi:hypothetical protein